MSLRGQCRAAASDNCEFEACSLHSVMLECWIYAILSWVKHRRQSTLRWVLWACMSVGVGRLAWCVVMVLCQCAAAVDRWPSELCERQWRLQQLVWLGDASTLCLPPNNYCHGLQEAYYWWHVWLLGVSLFDLPIPYGESFGLRLRHGLLQGGVLWPVSGCLQITIHVYTLV